MVYIREAHAADSSWPVPTLGNEMINEPKTLLERQSIAKKCCKKLNIEIPCLVDDMKNSTDKAYSAYPDRIFLVDKAGRLAVRADPGPWGLGPGVETVRKWLEEKYPDVHAEESTDGKASGKGR